MDWRPIDSAPKDGTRIMLWVIPGRASAKTPRATFGKWYQPPNAKKAGFWATEGGHFKDCPFWAPEPAAPRVG